jgi:hypothetical protein
VGSDAHDTFEPLPARNIYIANALKRIDHRDFKIDLRVERFDSYQIRRRLDETYFRLKRSRIDNDHGV